ncbi:MAG: T9SS type A sorting domain-containing protein [Ignavibacteria bacterium]|nr:T9SS type A sorting domain-containing protein [Ignavibacteria bacterium]
MKHTSHTRAVRFLSGLFYFLSIFIFINAFNFQHNPPGGWRQQFMPELGGQSISDVTFLDSLIGFAVTQSATVNDTGYILKTSNGGEIWNIVYRSVDNYCNVQFVNETTGFVAGGALLKSTNSGEDWFGINRPNQTDLESMFALSEDTIWLTDTEGLTGGVFRTTNGGTSWVRQLSLGSFNPDRIHMINGRNGFISQVQNQALYVRKTTDSGESWFIVDQGRSSLDMYFADSVSGWSAGFNVSLKATTNGGMNWFAQELPIGGNIYITPCLGIEGIGINKLWGVGGVMRFNGLNPRGILYFSSNGGTNWLFQLPDTSIRIGQYFFTDFVDKNNGWAYDKFYATGIHTTTGGDTTFTSVRQISDILPGDFILHQNYPNPFNGSTKIRFEINHGGTVSIGIFDITGRKLVELVNKQFTSGEYEVDYTTNENSSGIYFYSLRVDGILMDTKKMIVLK